MERSAKAAVVEDLKGIFTQSSAAVLVDYRGLGVNQLVGLRKDLNGVSSNMKIIKNTLAKIAAEGTPFEGLREQFSDTCAIVYNETDPVGQAKVLSKFAEENDTFSIKAGVLCEDTTGNVLTEQQIQALSKLPPKEELIAKLLYLLNAPITQFVRTLNEVPASFVRTLSAVAESKK